ncbi:hypothetical protein M427DRAFT_131362 [Gonapodya prolifera JEL478]|uniref:RING-type domain-containing protein n=1 Tax=Gonapodya prolifera (strain JEL478) TaxID=1344416 RepID=A0A139AV24_GONPJ|nr:hypothetical protein M427DRAFT_131362 [Gonapodya prolifera JEL478]|eukprot:KXS20590.1 hypothetical protein M427DRAFT_131362 [Gonapodya prolifera JEL478]
MGGCLSREEDLDDGADFPRRGYDADEPTLTENFTPVGPSFMATPKSPIPGTPVPMSPLVPVSNTSTANPPPPQHLVFARLTKELGYDPATVSKAFKALQLHEIPITVETAVSYISGEADLDNDNSVSALSPIPNAQFVAAREATGQQPDRLSPNLFPPRPGGQLTPFQQQWELPDPKVVPNAHLIIQDTPQPLDVVADLLRNMGYDREFSVETARTEAPQRELWSVSDLLGMVIHRQARLKAEAANVASGTPVANGSPSTASPGPPQRTSSAAPAPAVAPSTPPHPTNPLSPPPTAPSTPNYLPPHAATAPPVRTHSNFSLGSGTGSEGGLDTQPLMGRDGMVFAMQAPGPQGQAQAQAQAAKDETPLSPLAAAGEEDCKVCFSNKVDSVLVPCGHAVLCHACAAKVQYEGIGCPVCRAKVSMAVKVKGAE